jgi:protein involved in polysaccharide export with SLBB domain
MGQAKRYRMPTQYEQEELGPAPSFRGGEKRGLEQMPGAGTGMPPGLGVPGVMPPADTMMMGMSYQVHVLGEVMRPGTYRVPASERLASAIQRAGGMAENGSERRIELRRKGSKTRSVDLLRFKLFGRLDDNPYLMDNDVVFVPLRKKVIQVVGAVSRPDLYELKNEKTVADVVKLAGGFNAAVSKKEPIRIIRFVDGEKEVEDVTIDKNHMSEFSINNGDVVVVPNVVTKGTKFDYNVASVPGDQVFYPSYEDRVFVLGGVEFPGAYPFSPYYTISQYVSLAGGLSDRGIARYKVVTIDGKSRRVRENDRANPGDTVEVKERWMSPAGWMGFALGVASFGLSASATVLALTR